MQKSPFLRQFLAAVSAALAVDFVWNIFGGREEISEVAPFIGVFLPYLGVGVGCCVISYVVMEFSRVDRERKESWKHQIVEEMEGLRAAIQNFDIANQEQINKIDMFKYIAVTDKYNKWFRAADEYEENDEFAAFIIEMMTAHNYGEALGRIDKAAQYRNASKPNEE